MYSATLEWLCEHVGIIRIHKKLEAKLGDPYVWCCTFIKKYDVAHIKGVLRSPTISGMKALEEVLKKNGINSRIHERIKNNTTKHFERKIENANQSAI